MAVHSVAGSTKYMTRTLLMGGEEDKMDAREELQRLIGFDTVNDTATGKRPTRECPEYIASRLEEMGFITEILESEGYWTALARRGQGRFKILFLAHFDVVPPGEGWHSDPFEMRVDGDRAYGRGACDDKGNIVSLLLMAERLTENDPQCAVMIAATGDEEIGGANGAGHLREHLRKNGLYPDYVVVTDAINQVIIHRRRNILPTEVKVRSQRARIRGRRETVRFQTDTFGTRSRHSAYMRPGVDRHSMLAASKYLDLHLHSVVSDIRGAFVKTNVVPDWVELDIVHPDPAGEECEYDVALTGLMRGLLPLAHAAFPTGHSDHGTVVAPNLLSLEDGLWRLYCDVRAITADAEPVQAAFERALDGKVELYSLRVERGAGPVDSDPSSRLIRAAEWALQKEGIEYRLMEGFGASDSRYFADGRAEVFDFGPRGGNVHGPDEWVSLRSIEEDAAFYHMLIEVLLRGPAGL